MSEGELPKITFSVEMVLHPDGLGMSMKFDSVTGVQDTPMKGLSALQMALCAAAIQRAASSIAIDISENYLREGKLLDAMEYTAALKLYMAREPDKTDEETKIVSVEVPRPKSDRRMP